MHSRDVALVGLAVDIAGAILLARSFMVKGVIDIYDETATRVGRNLALVKSTMIQRSEAWGGAALLFIGFALQIIAALEVGAGAAAFSGWWGLVVLLGIAGAVFAGTFHACARLGRQSFHRWALRNYDGHAFAAPGTPQEEQELLHHGRLYDLEPRKDEPLDTFAARLSQTVAILGKRYRGKLSLPSDIVKKPTP